MEPKAFLEIVREEAGLKDEDEAKQAVRLVFDLLYHEIAPDETEDVKTELPKELADIWKGKDGWLREILYRFTPLQKFTRKEFIDRVNARKGDLPATGEKLTRTVFYALQNQISRKEATDISAQLPDDLRVLWNEAAPVVSYTGSGGVKNEVTPDIGGEFSKGGFGDTV